MSKIVCQVCGRRFSPPSSPLGAEHSLCRTCLQDIANSIVREEFAAFNTKMLERFAAARVPFEGGGYYDGRAA